MILEAAERAHTLMVAARKRRDKLVEEAGAARKAATDDLYRQRAAVFDAARDRMAAARCAQPRDPAEIAACEQALSDAKALPAPDFAQVDAEHAAATAEADHILANECAEIRRQLAAGELDKETPK